MMTESFLNTVKHHSKMMMVESFLNTVKHHSKTMMIERFLNNVKHPSKTMIIEGFLNTVKHHSKMMMTELFELCQTLIEDDEYVYLGLFLLTHQCKRKQPNTRTEILYTS